MKRTVVLVIALLVGCSSNGGTGPTPPSVGDPPPPAPGASVQVQMQSGDDPYGESIHAFVPAEVSVTRGGTVTWNNTTGIVHNVTFAAAAGAPESVPAHASGSHARAFSTAGSFAYSCTLHPGMNGRVDVGN